ncbi:RNA polymerase sigma factor [Rhabdobacter roseus]|uniref:RNA polymerase sigma-70 factor (ECF subfamily) n=1 Tax=Rhabdobacter roseus TaxID=1655419 RepID=A0A840U094_9BACT|nr:sigma-70 family RNA polymerase sigma factor [Rhabdobacter roseus]MBB5285560.1 RNA polymerase sigma-70 factor (ECF subfamily) [Rhabdobacter roseus]
MSLLRPKKYETLEELVRACQRQEVRAQTVLYERYKTRLLGSCLRYAKTKAEAEDIFQEAFVKVFRNLAELKEERAIDGWVKSIVIRTAINYYHRTTKVQETHISLDEFNADLESEEYARIIDQININVLLEIIQQLPDGYRMVVNLHMIDGYPHTEIAKMLDISEGTSRSQFLRGRNLLLKKLQEHGITQYENS